MSMTLFEKYFTHLLQEDNTTATGGAWGAGASIGQPSPHSSDFYASGDGRNLFGTGQDTSNHQKPLRKRKKRKKRKNKKNKLGEGPIIPIYRRKLNNGGL